MVEHCLVLPKKRPHGQRMGVRRASLENGRGLLRCPFDRARAIPVVVLGLTIFACATQILVAWSGEAVFRQIRQLVRGQLAGWMGPQDEKRRLIAQRFSLRH